MCAAGYYEAQPPEPQVWDFTALAETLTTWTEYAESLGGTSQLSSYAFGGTYSAGTAIGYIEIPLPGGYDRVEVHFDKKLRGGIYLRLVRRRAGAHAAADGARTNYPHHH